MTKKERELLLAMVNELYFLTNTHGEYLLDRNSRTNLDRLAKEVCIEDEVSKEPKSKEPT